MPNVAASMPSASTLQTAKKRWRLRYYGYVLDHEWYYAKALALYGPSDPNSERNFRMRFVLDLIDEAGLRGYSTLKAIAVGKETELLFTLASNRSANERKLPPQEKIDKLKSLLETDEPPKWYLA